MIRAIWLLLVLALFGCAYNKGNNNCELNQAQELAFTSGAREYIKKNNLVESNQTWNEHVFHGFSVEGKCIYHFTLGVGLENLHPKNAITVELNDIGEVVRDFPGD